MYDNDGNLLPFPHSRSEALALLYVKSQDLSGKTPAEIAEMFEKAYEEIINRP